MFELLFIIIIIVIYNIAITIDFVLKILLTLFLLF